jgi:hypothetical protein
VLVVGVGQAAYCDIMRLHWKMSEDETDIRAKEAGTESHTVRYGDLMCLQTFKGKQT